MVIEMILKYDEALEKADNKEWFKSFYKKDEVSDDDTVDEINELVTKLGGNQILTDYFEIKDDMILLKMYEDDLFDYLYDLEDQKAQKKHPQVFFNFSNYLIIHNLQQRNAYISF